MSFEVDHARLTGIAHLRPFYQDKAFRAQDDKHFEMLNAAGDFARGWAGLPPLDEAMDELASFRPGRELREEVRQRKRQGEDLPVWLTGSDWERLLATDWSRPGNLPRSENRLSPMQARLLIPRNTNANCLEEPDVWGPPDPVYRNVPYYDGIVPLVALVWWQRTEDRWRGVKQRPPVGVSHHSDFQSPTNQNKRPGAKAGWRGPLGFIVGELFRQAGVATPPSARQIERLVKELRNAEFPV